jgi:hypothetical protein
MCSLHVSQHSNDDHRSHISLVRAIHRPSQLRLKARQRKLNAASHCQLQPLSLPPKACLRHSPDDVLASGLRLRNHSTVRYLAARSLSKAL